MREPSAKYLVRTGYKQTDVGLIPEDWAVSSLQSACGEPITYGIVQCGPHAPNGIPYVRVSDMGEPELDVDGMLRTIPAIAARFARSTVLEGDLIYALRGKLGEVRKVSASVAGANLTQGTARLSPGNGVASDYLLWAMRSSRLVRQAEVEAKGTTFREITLADLRRIRIAIPGFDEQRAIATALGDIDALLAGLDRLIAKKRDVKQAAMQQLLTGQTRLPGFQGEWEVKRFDDVLVRLNAKACQIQTANYLTSGAFPVVDQGKAAIVGFSDETDRRFRCPDGGVIVFGDHTCIVKFIYFDFLVGADGTQVLRGRDGQSTLFHAFQLQYRGIAPTGYNRHFKFLAERDFLVPPYPEQTAIATILSDMDAELTALQARRDKTRALKQGMMQELLTGRTRLV